MPTSDRSTTVKLSKTLCYYFNPTAQIQLIRVTNGHHFNLEKIVFPQQRILFEAMPEAQLEIYNSQSRKPKIAKIIPCQILRAN